MHRTEATLFDRQQASIDARFRAFHEAHPEVYSAFVQFALERRMSGRRSYSADAVMHRVRWETDANSDRAGGFKIDNSLVSRYARKAMREHHMLYGFFKTRRLKSRREAA